MKRAFLVLTVIGGAMVAPTSLCLADDIHVVYFTYNPISYSEGGEPKGAAIEIVKKMAQGFDLRIDSEPIPIKRILTMAKASGLIVAALGRTPEREDDFIWLGQLYCDDIVMATLPPTPRVDTIDQARKLRKIGTGRGAAAEDFLAHNSFDNVESSGDMVFEAKKLQAGRIDGWFYPRLNILSVWRYIGGDEGELQVGAPLSPLCLWVAVSKPMSPDIVELLRARLDQMIQDRTVATELEDWMH